MLLSELKAGKRGIIKNINCVGAVRRRFLDLGIIPKTTVLVRKIAPMGDPIEIFLRGYELTIRLDDARNIDIEEIETSI